MITNLVKQAINERASDIHITSDEVVAFRRNRQIIKTEIFMHHDDVIDIAKHLCKERFDLFLDDRQIDLSGEIENIRYRANCYYEKGSIAIAIRLLSREVKSIIQLGLPSTLFNFVDKPHGLILVTGPTGSGKSTTLAAMINEINKSRPAHIMTIEDPIEYIFDNKKSIIHQREIGADVTSFHEGLRSVLRQDPDVIMIGELRDKITIETALKASETGHLVLTTLHTSDVASTINRFTGVFSSDEAVKIRHLLADSLIAIVSQKLIPTKDGNGMVPAFEILVNHTPTANLIRKGEVNQVQSYLLMDQKIGSIPMTKSIEQLVKNGFIDPS